MQFSSIFEFPEVNMGSSQSTNHNPMDLMEHHGGGQYTDMNMIFKGIPKMLQVADDMHRMTDYIMDLRNLTLAVLAISTFGLVCFIILKLVHNKSSRRKRRSIQRQIEEGYPPAAPRYYYSSQYAPEPWDRPKHNYSPSLDEKKQNEVRNGSPDFKANGSVNYKPYTNESSEISPEVEKKTSLTNDMSHRGTANLPKRSLDPVKLVVGDLPYVDSS
ncbi:unnamed protein product [Caenorhabditis angaria]|uniref:Uncharacterized protein n=1 Tax=Caenorhabditis angaria TaxID=860376 RepID=A0A9P1J0X7_9PELO|nr:unnamed protein product [Caenorhabditis angaria]